MKRIWGKTQRYLRWVGEWKWRFLLVSLVVLLGTFLLATPVLAVPSIVPAVLPSGQVGVAYLQNLTAFGNPPYIWTPGALPPGLTFASIGNTATISGTPTTVGNYTFVLSVTDADPATITVAYSIVITAAPITFTTTTLPAGKEGKAYSTTITVSGGTTPRTFSVSSGTLPSGLTLNATTGVISGTLDKGTAGTYTITITVTDSSTPQLSASQSFSLVIEKGFFDALIKISTTLAAGGTNVYVDGKLVAKLEGGGTTTQSFAIGAEATITVQPTVSDPDRADIRYVADEDEIVVDELSPNATFTYTPEYYVDLKTDPSQITTLTGTGWYKEGDYVRSSAPAEVEKTTGTQCRFAYWLLPNGNKVMGEDLSWIVTTPGKVTATYDTYYLLTVNSAQGKVEGSGWYKSGAAAKWSINPPEVPMTGILGFFQGKLKPDNATGTEVMDAPKTIMVAWNPDYTLPGIFISLLALFIIGGIFGLYRLTHPPAPKPVAPTVAPASPTIVVINGAQKAGLDGTREQLVDQFRQLLQKYENEVKTTVKGEGLPEAKVVPETQRLAAPKEKAPTHCGHTSKKLLRTVVGNWRKAEENVLPPEEGTGAKGVSISTIWARDIYKEWDVSVCTLPHGHSGSHHGTITKGYTLQDTATEEMTYSARQKTTPPKSHFTDELPVVDIAPHQIMPAEEAITPDEVIPPDQPMEG